MKRPAPSKRKSPRIAPSNRSRNASDRPFCITGIGASAGGLEAMTQLLAALPEKPGMALVLVQHLDPTHESAMASLLSRATSMPVLEARNSVSIEADHVYIIPPNKLMEVADRRLKLSPRGRSKEAYAPIDHFFRSLAREEGSRAIGVVLSGSGGGDGTQGLLTIKAAGGITFAQDQETAKYPTMPGAAVAAGCVDFVLPPDKVANELARLAGNPYIAPASGEPEKHLPAEEKAFADILQILRRQMNVDFSQYKLPTLHRRVHRRTVLHKFDALKDYANFLRAHPAEVRELFQDILIHVTGFFRDPSVFQTLKRKVVPRLLKGRSPHDPVRIWVPGCSTGEEPYSLAMILLEYMADKKTHYPVQIFGTDINERSLDQARTGIYPDSIQNDVSPERLRRFFLKSESGGYRINKNVREMCIFARQNVVSDPPFSNLDLISCRNVLIYLGQPLQRKVVPLFHYSLKPTGSLLLGSSETIGSFAELFTLVDKSGKIYDRRETRARPAVAFGQPALTPQVPERPAPRPAAEPAANIGDVQKHADRMILMQHSPAGVVINRQMEVLQFRGKTGLFLEHAHGDATLNLLKMAKEGLVFPLRTVLVRAMKQNVRVREENIPLRQNNNFQLLAIEAVPFQIPPGRERFYLVLFEPMAAVISESGRKQPGPDVRKTAQNAELARVREELASTKESLQVIIEEQEATNEELRSANEEIMSSNEELQSTNEELETAKEELQSTNEELATLNDELENRNSELEQINNDMFNLQASVNIPIVMVGRDLRIRRFTAVSQSILNLIPTDVGRPLTDINMKISVPELAPMVTRVIDTLQTWQSEVKDASGHWWSVRIRPYKTTDNKIDGAVLAMVDVEALKGGLEPSQRLSALDEGLLAAARQPMMVLDGDLAVQQVNEAFYRFFKTKAGATLHRRVYDLEEGQWNIPKLRTLLEDILPKSGNFQDFEIEHEFPRIGPKKLLVNARRLRMGRGQPPRTLLAIEEKTD